MEFEDLAYDEIVQEICKELTISSDKFHDGDNANGAYHIIVAERLLTELKTRVVLTAI
mgnify:CR=1 FL=1